MIPLDEARQVVLDGCRPLPTERVGLRAALGCVLAERVVAVEAVPPFANSAMDGFAVRADDVVGATDDAPVTLTVVGTIPAGAAAEGEVGAGEAMRIMTGAPMPVGADAVVMVERTRIVEPGDAGHRPDAERVAVAGPVGVGANVRGAGDDVAAGDVVLVPPTLLGPGHLGVLASVGAIDVLVHRRPRVGVMSTGDELVEGGAPLGPGQIRDSNRLTLVALLERAGCTPVDLGLVADDEAAITAAITAGIADCDALVTSGGVSMGDFDYVKVVLDRLGEMRWMQVAVRPAKPLAFGTVVRAADGRSVPVLGLPGNPVSSMVSFELFARPAIRKLAGWPPEDWVPAPVPARARVALERRPDGKSHFVRVRCTRADDGVLEVEPSGAQGSHQLTAMAAAQALAVLPDGAGVDAGEGVEVLLLEA